MRKVLIPLFASLFVLGTVSVAAPLSLPIINSDFDDSPGSGPFGWTGGAPSGWGAIGNVGVFNPTIYELSKGSYTGHDGSDVALVYSDGGVLGQWLTGVSPATGRTYTLSVQAAGRIGLYEDATYKLRLVAGTTDYSQWVELAISDPFTPVEGVFQESNLSYSPTSLNPAYSVLGINLLVFGASIPDQVLFDNVSLENHVNDSGNSVPDSSVFLLLGPSLVGLGIVGRRKFSR